jgi:hypothetical protein
MIPSCRVGDSIRSALVVALGLCTSACITIDRTAPPSGARLDFQQGPPAAGRTWRCEDGGSLVLEPGARPRLWVGAANLIVDNHARRQGKTVFFHWQGDGFGVEYQVPDGAGPLKIRVHAMWKWALEKMTAGQGNFASEGGAVSPVSGYTAFLTDACAERGSRGRASR